MDSQQINDNKTEKNNTIFTLLIYYAIPLSSAIITLSLIFCQIIPSINLYLKLRDSNENLSIKTTNLKVSLEQTDKYYKDYFSSINLGLELLNKIAPIESGRISTSQNEIDEFIRKNSLSLSSYKFSENIRDIVNDSVADELVADDLKLRVAVSEAVVNGTYKGISGLLQNIYKSGKLTIIESLTMRNNSNAENTDNWNARIIISKYWYSEDYMKNIELEYLLQNASQKLNLLLLEKVKAKI